MNILLINTVVRQLMTMAGSVMVAGGYATSDQWVALSGGVVAGVSVIWGLFNAKKQEAVVKSTAPVVKK